MRRLGVDVLLGVGRGDGRTGWDGEEGMGGDRGRQERVAVVDNPGVAVTGGPKLKAGAPRESGGYPTYSDCWPTSSTFFGFDAVPPCL